MKKTRDVVKLRRWCESCGFQMHVSMYQRWAVGVSLEALAAYPRYITPGFKPFDPIRLAKETEEMHESIRISTPRASTGE